MSADTRINFGSPNIFPIGEVRTKVVRVEESSSHVGYDQEANAITATPAQHIGTITFAQYRPAPLQATPDAQGPLSSTGQQSPTRTIMVVPMESSIGTKFSSKA